jgi:two-component system, LuxR family, sensor kinase FixL
MPMAAAPPIHVLVIEDDADTRVNLCDILELDGHRVDTAATVAEAFGRTNWNDYSAIILDRRLPDGTADEILPRLKAAAPHAAIMIVTGFGDLAGAIGAMRLGAVDYILKPVNPDALRGSLLRIAERQHLALSKERSEAAFRTLIEAAPCTILILRPDRTIVYFSPFAERLTGYSAAEATGKDYFALLIHEGNAHKGVGLEIQRVSSGVPMRSYECPVRCKDGSRRWLVWNAEALEDYEGESAVLAVGQDITNLKQAQEQALQSTRLAAIGQMVAGLAHESRNALQLIQASLEMLTLEVEDRPEALELIASIQGAEDRLHRLFEDIREYAAPVTFERDRYNIAKVWQAAWDQLSTLRNGRQVQFREEAEDIDLECVLDLFSVERVFRNIFENSLAACRDPAIIEIRCSETQLEGRPALKISIRDNGPGLTPEQKQKIFQPFYTTKRQGTGLGMAIAKRIIEAHRGQIAVGNDTRPGAEIIITLPRGTE